MIHESMRKIEDNTKFRLKNKDSIMQQGKNSKLIFLDTYDSLALRL